MTHRLSGLLSDLKIQSNCIDGDARATGEILEGSSEKSLGEIEATNPEDGWNSTRDPSLQKIDPLKQVWHPGGQRLKRWVGLEGERHTASQIYVFLESRTWNYKSSTDMSAKVHLMSYTLKSLPNVKSASLTAYNNMQR